jgi:hypothetical protein
MMFTLGHGFAEDPVLPWVGSALAEPAGGDLRARRVEQGLRDYLGGVLHYVDGG